MMHGFSLAVFNLLKGASYGFGTLVLVGVIALLGCVLFSRLNFKRPRLWAGVVAAVFLMGMLYFKDWQALISPVGDPASAAFGGDEAEVWFDLTANAVSGAVGILAGLIGWVRFRRPADQ